MQGLDIVCCVKQHFVGSLDSHPPLLSTYKGLLTVRLQHEHTVYMLLLLHAVSAGEETSWSG